MRIRRTGVLVAAVAMVAAWGCRGDQRIDFGGKDLGEERLAIVSTDGSVRLVLTDEHLYFALSEEVAGEARRDVEEDLGEDAGRLGRFISRTVNTALGFRAAYPVDVIEDVRWEDDEMRVVFVEGRGADLGKRFRIGDDESITHAFDEEAVLALRDELRAVKRERAAGR